MELVNRIEQTITEFIFQEMNIPMEDIDPDINLGAFGMSSVTGTKLIGILEEQLSTPLNPTLIFEFPTIGELAEEISKLSSVNSSQEA
ncbi:acyl carrier protein [Neptuniibacter sp. QD34_54]|uniref:acyl carrier protein n=1 Tax=Neptuniibacter sp. QD34_54 TaxID=3398208 RepID=UPI0039F6347A